MLTYNKDIKCGLCGDKGHPTSDCRLNIKEDDPEAYKLKEFKDVTQTVLVKGLNEADKIKYKLDIKEQPIPKEESIEVSVDLNQQNNHNPNQNSNCSTIKNDVNSDNSQSIPNDNYDTNTSNNSYLDPSKNTTPPQFQMINNQNPYAVNMIPGMFNNQFMFMNQIIQQKIMPNYSNMNIGKPMQMNPAGMKGHPLAYMHPQYMQGQKQFNNPYLAMYGNTNINIKFNQKPGSFGPNTPVFIPSSNYFDDDEDQKKKDEDTQTQ